MKNQKPIFNCDVRFKFRCPKDWDELARTENENTRYCDVCKRNVFFCASDEEMTAYARRGDCVARELVGDGDGLESRTMVGEAAHPYAYYSPRADES